VCNCNAGGDARPCYPSDLSDAAWAVIAPLIPVRDPARGGAPRKYGDRLVLDGIFFVLRSGCPWRMIPRDLLPWDAACRWYRAWTADGTRDRIHDELHAMVRISEGRDPAPSAGVLDAQSVLTGEGGQDRGYDAGKRTRGRKRHIGTGTLGLLLAVMVTSASVQDRHGGKAILERAAARFGSSALIWADVGYASQIDTSLVTWARTAAGIVLQIVRRSDDVKGFRVLPRRWACEVTFGWLIRCRRLSRDYERLTSCSETMIKIAMIRLMAIRLAGEQVHWSNRVM
jgi:transposase